MAILRHHSRALAAAASSLALRITPITASRVCITTSAAAGCSSCLQKQEFGTAEKPGDRFVLNPWRLLLASLVGAASGAGLAAAFQPTQCDAGPRASSGQTQSLEGPPKMYTREEVALHNSPDVRVWVTYKDSVYDVTDFLEQHPGGASRLMLAAGGAIDPFWNMYRQHQTQEVKSLLEGYRIGSLEGGADLSKQAEDPYANEPKRHPALIVRTDKPMNAETPPDVLASSPVTPTELFYVRNHLPVPHVDAANYSLRVEGEGLRTMELSLKDLQQNFKKHTVVATLQCSGNRRHQLAEIRPIKGLDWDTGAIGTAVFSGARLVDVLKHAGLDEETAQEIEHVQFEGLDSDVTGTCYGASIPVEKAISRNAEVLLAYEMNGSSLPLDHGFPVRVVVPGVTGARSVKWLSRIIASQEESQSHWQQNDYKSFSPTVDWDNVDWSSAPAIQDTNVQSAICDPKPGSVLEGPMDSVAVSGYAYSGGGRRIVRVDVSADGGESWTTAELKLADRHSKRGWAWTLWDAEVPVPPELQAAELDICCKATDEAYNCQPDEPKNIWNLRGVLNNAVHHVKVQVE